MSTKDIDAALARVHAAEASMARIAMLPRTIGTRVRWPNGVIWERVDDDGWQPINSPVRDEQSWPSSHVARQLGWKEVPS